jgi:phosphoribosylformylglycinamidine synthase
MELFWHGEKCADIPVQPVSEEAPVLDRPVAKPAYLDGIEDITLDKEISNQVAFDDIFSDIEVVDKSWIYSQYDSMVQTNTVKGPGKNDGSVIRIKETGKALAMSADCNTRQCYINPELGAAAAVMESGRNVAMTGAVPKAITDCLNFGNPQNPEVMWQFAASCEGIKSACKELNTPVIGGNVSLYNETNGVGVFPTPAIAMVGVNDDANKSLPSSVQENGNILFLLGETKGEFGASLYMKKMYGKVAGTHPEVDFKKELSLWNTVIEANKAGLLKSAKDVNVGGIAIALAKMSVVGNKGIEANISLDDSKDIFAESLSRAIVEVRPENVEAFEKVAASFGIECNKIGQVAGDKISINDIYKDLSDAKDVYFNKFRQVIEQDL